MKDYISLYFASLPTFLFLLTQSWKNRERNDMIMEMYLCMYQNVLDKGLVFGSVFDTRWMRQIFLNKTEGSLFFFFLYVVTKVVRRFFSSFIHSSFFFCHFDSHFDWMVWSENKHIYINIYVHELECDTKCRW